MFKNNISLRTDFCDELIVDLHDDSLSYKKTETDYASIIEVKVKKEENALQKEIGEYITIEFDNIHDYQKRQNLIIYTAKRIKVLFSMIEKKIERVLIIGLGNREVVSDALGPMCCDNVLVTAHLYENEDKEYLKGTRNCAVFVPGVMGQTGIESAAMIESVAKLYQPDVIIVIDALATSSMKRINRAIQINNVGIKPGSGVGNHRKEISEKKLGIPVITVGVATVTSIGTLLREGIEQFAMEEDTLVKFSECMDLDLIVTPKSMDKDLKYLSDILSKSINYAIHPDYENL